MQPTKDQLHFQPSQQLRARQEATPETLWISRAVIRTYGRELGAYGVAIYAVLCSEDKKHTGEITMSVRDIARSLKINTMTVQRHVAILCKHRIVSKGVRKRPGSREMETTTYGLLALPEDLEGASTAVQDVDPAQAQPPEPMAAEPMAAQPMGAEPRPAVAYLPQFPAYSYSAGFQAFCAAYPKDRLLKVVECHGLWHGLGLEARTEEICGKVQRLDETLWDTTERRFVTTAYNFLKSRQFEDPLLPEDTQPQGRSRREEDMQAALDAIDWTKGMTYILEEQRRIKEQARYGKRRSPTL